MTSNLLAKTKKIEITPRIKSDHNPVLWSGKNGRKKFRWHLNEDLFFNYEYTESTRKKTNQFFQINLIKDSKIQTIWDAYKATIRGELIALNAVAKRRRKKNWTQFSMNYERRKKI